ncbi:MAG TPA: aspartate aminotransferase family protein [Gammaproteobacteria bacterium]|nr:aspartate aminotransferase family protein [Gammaproteobacteria bacterium]
MSEQLMDTYSPLPVAFERGEGVWLWDTEGKRYLDALSGIAVCNLGHAHPLVAKALCEQAGKLLHTSNIYHISLQERLAGELNRLAGMERAFFCNSGAEANEAAIKLARLYGHGKGIKSPAIIVTGGSFHGRTMATLSATGNRRIQAGFEPLVRGFVRVEYNDLEAMRNVAKNDPEVVAVLVEPVQGEGGIRIPDEGYLAGLRALCDEQGWLLMLDEVQTGMGRTGEMFAFQHSGITPDVTTLAKGLGNGVPIGACLARGEAAKVFRPGSHGTTFGGNPLVCSAALAVVETLQREDLPARAALLGERMLGRLRDSLADNTCLRDIRGMGLMLGIELNRPCGELVEEALRAGLLINVTATSVIRLLPPLILNEQEADQIVDTVVRLIDSFAATDPVAA